MSMRICIIKKDIEFWAVKGRMNKGTTLISDALIA